MDVNEVIEFLEEKRNKLARDEPYAVNAIDAYDKVIEYLGYGD